MTRAFKDITWEGENLSQEARTIADEAAQAMRKWINESCDEIEKEYIRAVEEAANDLKSRFDEAESSLKELSRQQEEIRDILSDLRKKSYLPKNNPNLLKALENMEDKAEKARQAVAEEREKFRNIGRGVTTTLVSTVKKGIGIPV